MMKKIVLGLALLMILSVTFASDYNSTSGETTITLHNGWNLVPTMTNTSDPDGCLTGAGWLYYYSGVLKQYVGTSISPQGTYFPDKATYDQVTQSEYKQQDTINNPYYGVPQLGGMWVYSSKYCSFKAYFSTQAMIQGGGSSFAEYVSKAKLARGWNFIHMSSWMIGKTLKDIFSNCQVTATNNWDPIGQSWIYQSSTGSAGLINQNSAVMSEANIGLVLPIKVASECSLSYYGAGSIAPPALPN